ncbi:MAG: hypothetical protein K8R49_02180 [Candidatus Cloacimonetes bacterium]|nr:hypothetical protein [Candidatus Cloacimonadota bacterium]
MRYFSLILLLILISSFLHADLIPPYVNPLYPLAGATGIPVDTDVTFHIFDDVDGVDINSVIVNINGINYTISDEFFFYSGTPYDYIITINPPMNFQFGQIVNIQIDADDLATPHNTMTTYSYSFECIDDMQPPYVGALDPEQDAIGIPVDTDVTFHIYDSGIGVNLNSVVVEIQGITYTHNSGNFTYSGNSNNYYIIIDVPVNFELGEIVSVLIDGADLNGLAMSTFEYSFQIIEDVSPPYTGEWFPEPGSTGVPVETDISFNIYDNIEGVNINSVEVEIQGITYTYLNTTFSYVQIPYGYTITIDPSYDFDYGEVVNVSIDAVDLSQPPNQMSTFTYNFQCIIDEYPPYTGNYDPMPGQQNVPINTNILFHVYDDDLGVDINTLIVDVNGEVYSIANGNLAYTGNVNDYGININPVQNFSFGEIVTVQIEVYDLAVPANTLTNFSYSFQCIDDDDYPYVGEFDPEPYSTDNPTDCNITFHIYDDGYGVDINSVVVNVEGIEYSLSNGNIFHSGNVNDYYIIVNPVENLSPGDTVNVSIDACDLAVPPHVMGTYNYSFQCVYMDIYPPFLWEPSPPDGAIGVAIDTSISFYILDNESGVDSTSIVFKVNDEIIENYDIEAVTILGGAGFGIDYDPPDLFDFEEIVTVSVSAQDLAIVTNTMPETFFTFECEENQPPSIALPDSFAFEEDETLIENFSPYITDPENDIPILETTLTTNIDVTIDGYMVTFRADENWFGTEQITFVIKNDEGQILAFDITEIVVTPVNDAPIFNLDELPDFLFFEENKTLLFDIGEYTSDPEQQLSELTLSITGNTNIETNISGLEVLFSAPANWTGSEVLSFTVEDNQTRLSSCVEITITVTPEAPEEKVKVEPHTLTWDDPTCMLTIYTQENIDKIKCKIFNRRGKLIRKLNVESFGDNKIAQWDKKDSNSNEVSGGFYIYQVKIKNRTFQGSIIIAR